MAVTMPSTAFIKSLTRATTRCSAATASASRPRAAAPIRSLTTSSTTSSSPSPSPSTSHPPPPSAPPARRSSPSTGTQLYFPPPSTITSHLSSILPPQYQLEEEIALRVMTHKSAANVVGNSRESKTGHGEKLAFLGRRVLRLHLSLHLASLPSSSSSQSLLSDTSLSLILSTPALGSGPGKLLQLEKALRWREVRGADGLPTGLYKSRGSAVEALIGAIYTQYGIEASSKVFKELILPGLELPVEVRAV